MSDGFSGSDNELVVGEIYGWRTWSTNGSSGVMIGADGRLWPRSIAPSQAWADGDNRASCHVADNHRIMETLKDLHLDPTQEAWRAHIASPECSCGFWAYWNLPGLQHWGGILGVVSAWGPVTEGPKGFRAGHARIEALYLPDVVRARGRGRMRLGLATKWLLRAVVLATVGYVSHGLDVLPWWGWLLALLPVTVTGCALWMMTEPAGYLVGGIDRRWGLVSPATQRLVAAHYPNAVVFGSIAQMRRAYPITKEET